MGREKSLRLGRMRAVYARSDRKPPDHCAAECLHSHGAVSCPGHAGWRPLTPRPAERRIRPWCPRERAHFGRWDLRTSTRARARRPPVCWEGVASCVRPAITTTVSLLQCRHCSGMSVSAPRAGGGQAPCEALASPRVAAASCRRALTTRGICIFSTDSTSMRMLVYKTRLMH